MEKVPRGHQQTVNVNTHGRQHGGEERGAETATEKIECREARHRTAAESLDRQCAQSDPWLQHARNATQEQKT